MANESIQLRLEQSLDKVKLDLKLDNYEIVFGDIKPSLNLQEVTVKIKDTRARTNRIALQIALFKELRRAHSDFIVIEKIGSPQAIKPIEFTDINKNPETGKPRLEGRRIFFKPLGRATPVTQYQESLVAYACSIHQELGRPISPMHLHKDNLPSTSDVHAVHSGQNLSLDECLGALNDEWWLSSCLVANAIMDRTANPFIDGSKSYKFHRGDRFMNDIYKKAREIMKASDETSKFGSMDMNKWNPGDIWLASSTLTEQKLLEKTKGMKSGIQQYNAMLTELFNSGDLCGVSLKKTSDKTVPTIKVVKNETKTLAANPQKITYVNKLQTTEKFQMSQSLQFNLDGHVGNLQFRNFSGKQSNGFQGNITKMEGQSEAAVHGKVGVWKIFLEDTGAIQTFKQTFGMYVEAKDLSKVNTAFADAIKNTSWSLEMEHFKNVYNKLNGKSLDNSQILAGFQSAMKTGKDGSYDFCSNLLGLQIIYMIHNTMSDKVKKDFLKGVVLYAMSQIPGISSIYIKNG